jgi:GAF domain-containing protein
MVVRLDAGIGAEDATLVVPIRLRGETLGALGLQETDGERWWTDDEIALIEAVADQMALAIENARLLEETQRRAAQERVLSDITAQVRASTQVDTILRTAVREIGRALRASEGVIKLGSGNDSGSHSNNEGGLDDDSADA